MIRLFSTLIILNSGTPSLNNEGRSRHLVRNSTTRQQDSTAFPHAINYFTVRMQGGI